MDEKDMPYREAPKSTEFVISREALDEAYSALTGCKAVLGDVANISHAMEQLKTAQGIEGADMYEGHDPQFVIGGSSEPMSDSKRPNAEEPYLGLATNAELENELRVRCNMGHTHPDYKTSGYDGPVA
jgi:hypothetical protein